MATSTAHRASRFRERAARYLLFGILSVLIALAGIGLGFFIEGHWGDDAFTRWGGLIVFTLGLFALFVSDSEKWLRRWRFWSLTAILLTMHLAAFVLLLTHVHEWRLTWFMVMVLEYPVFLAVRGKFVTSR
ncbi:MAG TPA: hypothetical protein VGF88_03870 [Acidobacteriaceae bacterium]|jgi:hypothetical protein